MSAAEIIEQIKALPLEERREISRFLRELSPEDSPGENSDVRYASDAQARAAGNAVVAEYPETFRRLAE
jgi:hypothetical protein